MNKTKNTLIACAPFVRELYLHCQPSTTVINAYPITTNKQMYHLIYPFFNPNTIALQEEFIVAFFDRHFNCLGIYKVSIGGMAGTVVDIRLIASAALLCGACQVVFAHNHPSGAVLPSKTDIKLTKIFKKAFALLGIELVEHLVVSPTANVYESVMQFL